MSTYIPVLLDQLSCLRMWSGTHAHTCISLMAGVGLQFCSTVLLVLVSPSCRVYFCSNIYLLKYSSTVLVPWRPQVYGFLHTRMLLQVMLWLQSKCTRVPTFYETPSYYLDACTYLPYLLTIALSCLAAANHSLLGHTNKTMQQSASMYMVIQENNNNITYKPCLQVSVHSLRGSNSLYMFYRVLPLPSFGL